MAILIADSGATSTDWLYVDGEHVSNYQTQGLYPSFINPETDLKSVKSAIGQLTPNTICFYGTGCGISEADEIVRTFLKRIFPDATIHIKSDLEGAGIAFFGKGSGIVAVLGTGSICARMEEGKLTQRSAALGYVIGDEGSAADLGRRILKVYFREAADRETIAFIANKLDHVEYGAMINRIYK